MDALIPAAAEAAALAGAPALEAYPVDTTIPGHTGNLFPGVASTFARHGFEVVARHKPDRPVMRKLLGTVGGLRGDQQHGRNISAATSTPPAPLRRRLYSSRRLFERMR